MLNLDSVKVYTYATNIQVAVLQLLPVQGHHSGSYVFILAHVLCRMLFLTQPSRFIQA